MIIQSSSLTRVGNKFAGKSAIASGIAGIIAFGFLFAFLIPHLTEALDGGVLIRSHDLFVILQFLLLIPVVGGLYRLSILQLPTMTRTMKAYGIAALSFTILFLLLIFPKILADTLYMVPQGLFGLWLTLTCWRMKGIASLWLRRFGMLVGIGLALVGTFPLGYAIFVDTINLKIPAAKPEEFPTPDTLANGIIHLILLIGSLIGVVTLPVWSILIGRKLFLGKA